jgi:hypothetical protein
MSRHPSRALRASQTFRDKAGIVHTTTGSYGTYSLTICEAGTPDMTLMGLEQVYDTPVTCILCLGTR